MLKKQNEKQTAAVLLHEDGEPIKFILFTGEICVGQSFEGHKIVSIDNESSYPDCDIEITVTIEYS